MIIFGLVIIWIAPKADSTIAQVKNNVCLMDEYYEYEPKLLLDRC